ncbi:MAG: gliding motility lipoprotein GldH [Bacteroidales bacterium]
MTKGLHSRLLIFVITILLSSCGKNVVFTDSEAMRGNTWKIADIPVFSFPVKDTVTNNNIYFTIRTGSAYPYRNIYLFVTTSSPNGKSVTDTLNYDLADGKGKWFGKGFGDIHELRLPYKTNVYFPLSGTYSIRIQHGMRIEDLAGVYDVGLRVEKAAKK